MDILLLGFKSCLGVTEIGRYKQNPNLDGLLTRDVPATQVRPLAESSKLKAESGLDEPLSFELRASILSMP